MKSTVVSLLSILLCCGVVIAQGTETISQQSNILNTAVVGYSSFSGNNSNATHGTQKSNVTMSNNETGSDSKIKLCLNSDNEEQTYFSKTSNNSSTRSEITVMLRLDMNVFIKALSSKSDNIDILKSKDSSDSYQWGFGVIKQDANHIPARIWQEGDNSFTALSAGNPLPTSGELTLTVISNGNGTTFYWGEQESIVTTTNETGGKWHSKNLTTLELNAELTDSISQFYVFNKALNTDEIQQAMGEMLFYVVPEPYSVVLGVSGVFCLLLHRKRA